MMLPYMEQTPIYNAINFSVVSESNNYNDDRSRRRPPRGPIASFLCPSDQPEQFSQYSGGPAAVSYMFPGNNYFASIGSSMNSVRQQPVRRDDPVGSAAPNGLVPGLRAADRHPVGHDGTSNTIAMGEWITGSPRAPSTVRWTPS